MEKGKREERKNDNTKSKNRKPPKIEKGLKGDQVRKRKLLYYWQKPGKLNTDKADENDHEWMKKCQLKHFD